MAEFLGLVASVASLIALTSETAKACNKLVKSINLFVNAPVDVQRVSAELLDLAHILELFQSTLRPLCDDGNAEQVQVDFNKKSLARVRSNVEKIADLLISVQSKARGGNMKGWVKWAIKRDDVASMMTIIDRQKQNLLMQVNLLNLKITSMSSTDPDNSRRDMEQIGSHVENLTESFKTSSSYTASHIDNSIQSSTASLQTSLKDEISRAMSTIPRETNISRASLETLSALVSQTVASQFESFTSQDTKGYPDGRFRTGRKSDQRMTSGPQTEFVEFVTAGTQSTVDEYCEEQPGTSHREVESSRLTSRTSVQKMTSFLGTMLVRRSTINSTFPKSNTGIVIGWTKLEIDFSPAHWLQSWTGCRIFLARMGFGKPRFGFSFAVARVLDFDSDPHARNTWKAVESGDLDALRRYLRSQIAYPTDRDMYGNSLLGKAAIYGQFETCKLLLEQGAGIDINTPSNDEIYPIHYMLIDLNDYDEQLVRLFLSHNADLTLMDPFGSSPVSSALFHPFPEFASWFRFLTKNDPSFDIHQRNINGRTLLMQASGHNRQIYKELLRLGANASDSDADGSTVLHHFFSNINMGILWPSVFLDNFLDSGEILALSIQAGADAKAKNRFRRRPYEHISWPIYRHPSFDTVLEEVNLAFWHQALRISGQCPFQCCDCPHHVNKIQHEYGSSCQSCQDGLDNTFPFDTFEEEIVAALARCDRDTLQQLAGLSKFIAHRWEEAIQESIVELDARRRKTRSSIQIDPIRSANHHPESTEADSSQKDQTHIANNLQKVGPASALQDIDSGEEWETTSSSSSDDEWESAPET